MNSLIRPVHSFCRRQTVIHFGIGVDQCVNDAVVRTFPAGSVWTANRSWFGTCESRHQL